MNAREPTTSSSLHVREQLLLDAVANECVPAAVTIFNELLHRLVYTQNCVCNFPSTVG